ncbi:Ribonuclease PH [Pseudomonas savastanoi pv. glycinea]|nr:Ribonuclease PH [Pseudomonas savastanoi pv. glycinea]
MTQGVPCDHARASKALIQSLLFVANRHWRLLEMPSGSCDLYNA